MTRDIVLGEKSWCTRKLTSNLMGWVEASKRCHFCKYYSGLRMRNYGIVRALALKAVIMLVQK